MATIKKNKANDRIITLSRSSFERVTADINKPKPANAELISLIARGKELLPAK